MNEVRDRLRQPRLPSSTKATISITSGIGREARQFWTAARL